MKRNIANWSKALYRIVSIGRSRITNGPIYTISPKDNPEGHVRVLYGNRIQVVNEGHSSQFSVGDNVNKDEYDLVEAVKIPKVVQVAVVPGPVRMRGTRG